jgi:hypothetical protein
MKNRFWLFAMLVAAILFTAAIGCQSKDKEGPKDLLDRYFASAVRQDYAATYACYYAPYTAKVTKEEYMKRRKEASVLQSYDIVSVKQDGDSSAHAEVRLTFTPSEKLNRTEPVSTIVKEDLIKENGKWKIKVW